MTSHLFMIGGGEIGGVRNGMTQQIETQSIDEEIIKASGKKKPNLLFFPTAKNDSAEYCERIQNYFGTVLGCNVNALKLISENLSHDTVKLMILNSDIIYVGGGNAVNMLEIWKKYNITDYLHTAWKQGAVISGNSAGACCWNDGFCARSAEEQQVISYPPDSAEMQYYQFVPGLSCTGIFFTPHYSKKDTFYRKSTLAYVAKTGKTVFGCTDKAVIHMTENDVRVLTASDDAAVYKVVKEDSEVREIKLPVNIWLPYEEFVHAA